MAGIDSTHVEDALVKKLQCVKNKSSDHNRFTLHSGATVISSTKISHGAKHTIDDNILTQMARQIGLGTKKNLVECVSCTKSRDECLAIIATNTQ